LLLHRLLSWIWVLHYAHMSCPSQLGSASSSSPIKLLHRLLSWISVLHSAHMSCPSQLGPTSSSSPIKLLLHRLLSWNLYNSLLYHDLQWCPSVAAPKNLPKNFPFKNV
jgi:hypothetical protein